MSVDELADKGSSDPRAQLSSRRRLLRQMAGVSLGLPLAPWRTLLARAADKRHKGPAPLPPPATFGPEDERFLDELEHSSFLYFWEQANPQTGLIKDRCNARTNDTGVVASIASTGFGLTAICIAEKRGFVSRQDARVRVLATLTFLWQNAAYPSRILLSLRQHRHRRTNVGLRGLFRRHGHLAVRHPYLPPALSTIATSADLAHAIFDRVDWTWLSEDTTLLTQGWTPEYGFLPYKWDYYSELMMIYLLGMGSSSHPLRPDAWSAWKRTTFEYDGLRYIGSFAPLFVHQYSQAWFDFRQKRDKYADYFHNSAIATDVHRRFCIELSKSFPDYSDDLWGITASDSDKGYVIWGGPPAMGPIDGTVVPAASGGSLPFLPETSMRVLRNIRTRYQQAWSRYGFVDAFNPLKNWYDTRRHRHRHRHHHADGGKYPHCFCVGNLYEKPRGTARHGPCRLYQL